jgi:hypothetical protein
LLRWRLVADIVIADIVVDDFVGTDVFVVRVWILSCVFVLGRFPPAVCDENRLPCVPV